MAYIGFILIVLLLGCKKVLYMRYGIIIVLLNSSRMRQRKRMRYKIYVKTLQGDLLTFSTDFYEVDEGFVTWIDVRTEKKKRFHSSNCEIEEERENDNM